MSRAIQTRGEEEKEEEGEGRRAVRMVTSSCFLCGEEGGRERKGMG